MIPPELVSIYCTVKSRTLLATLSETSREIEKISDSYHHLPDEVLLEYFSQVKAMAKRDSRPGDLEVELFSLVRELAYRKLDREPYAHPRTYFEQLLAALALSRYKIIQMNNGEGKTLVAPFAAIMENLCGRRVVVVTSNDYLALRDAQLMAPLYQSLGISISSIQPWYGKAQKHRAYSADVIYVSTDRLVFDFLHKHHGMSRVSNYPIPFDSVIIDEVDNVLLDQAVSPYALASPINFKNSLMEWADGISKHFIDGIDFYSESSISGIEFTDSGYEKLSDYCQKIQVPFAEMLFYCTNSLLARHHYKKDNHYIIYNDRITPIDKITGMPLSGSSFSFPIQQALECKEGVEMSPPNKTINSITLQSFFKGFDRICGMSGSAIHNAIEFKLMYKLDVVIIPTHRPNIRVDATDIIYKSKSEQIQQVVQEIIDVKKSGRPILVGTTNIDDAELLARVCSENHIDFNLLTARNHFDEALLISRAGRAGAVTIAAQMAGRGIDIKLDPVAFQSGGLHVIGVGRDENRRLDEQLQGRAARQGDPGSSVFIISLEDDLMQVFGSQNLQKMLDRIGIEENEPIEHPMVDRAVKRAQRNLTIFNFYKRQTSYIFDEHLNQTRQAVFRRREQISRQIAYDFETNRLIDNYARRLSDRIDGGDSSTVFEELAKGLRIDLSPQIRRLIRDETGNRGNRLRDLLLNQYSERRAQAGEFATARERMILLRCIDYCWSLFIDQQQNKFESMNLFNMAKPRIEILSEIRKGFFREEEKLTEEIEQISLFYLMHIHEEEVLREIKYWRGMGISYGGEGDGDQLDDGISVPEHYLMVYREDDEEPPALPPKDLLFLGDGGQRQELKFSEYLQMYITSLAEAGATATQIDLRRGVLEDFARFADLEDKPITEALSQRPNYMATLKSKGLVRRTRKKHNEIIFDFILFLRKNRYISAQLTIGTRQKLKNRLLAFAGQIADPILLVQYLFIVVSFLLYRFLSGIPLPYLEYASNPFLALPVPQPVLILIDRLFLADSIENLSLGLIGIIPYIIIRSALKTISTGREISFESPFIYFPIIVLFSALAYIFLAGTASNIETVAWYQKAAILLTLCLCSFTITLLAWAVRYTEILTGIQMIMLGNFFLTLISGNAMLGSASTSLSWPPFFAMLAVILVLFVIYGRLSTVSLDVVVLGRFDIHAGKVKNLASKIKFNTFAGGAQYLLSFVVIEFIVLVANRISKIFISWSGRLSDFWESPALISGMFILGVWWLIYKKVQNQLGLSNVMTFLRKMNCFLQDTDSLEEAKEVLAAKRRKALMVNLFFETLIVGSTLGFFYYAFTYPHQLGIERALYLTALTSFGFCLVLEVFNKILSTFSMTESREIVFIPPPLEIEEDVSWTKRIYYNLNEKAGLPGILIALGGLLAFFEYIIRIVKWLWTYLFGG
ncbi:MAG: hypothetical protein JRI22_09010 [Deltaproteobacteria bacterium]|nr:hypothetical protein [Deltaproteobacteria bacterium]